MIGPDEKFPGKYERRCPSLKQGDNSTVQQDCQHMSKDQIAYTCVYRQLKSNRSGDEGRPEWRVNE
jgi:hypothetical protein